MDVNVFPSQNARLFPCLSRRKKLPKLVASIKTCRTTAFINIFGRRNENLCAEVIPPWKFNNYGWTGYEEFVEYVEIRRRRMGERIDFISFRWWHPEGEETSRAIIILFSILEMRPKEFRGLSNCEMSRDTSSLFPLPWSRIEKRKIFSSFINENIRNFCLSAKIDTAFCRRYSSFSIPSIGSSLFSIQFAPRIDF